MFSRFLMTISLFGFLSNLTINGYSLQYKKATDYFSLLHPNIENNPFKNEQIHFNWHDILFISILIFLFLLLAIGLYYQHSIVNFIFIVCSKTKNNNVDINEQITILHRTPPLKTTNSMYLTVPQPAYLHH